MSRHFRSALVESFVSWIQRSPARRLTVASALLFALAAPAQAHLLDGFQRADSATLGNGWIEKNAAAFGIAGNQVTKAAVATGYRDNLVYRPNSEDVLDVEAALEVRFTSLPPGYPQVLVRVQSATAATADVLDGYMLYVEDSTNTVILGRQNGSAFVTTLATLNLTTSLNATDRFRLRLRAQGTSPVVLQGFVERQNGAVWETIGSAIATDTSASRIATAGSVGFSGYVESNYVLDNFTRTDLGALGTTNPAPVLSAIAPASATAGQSGVTVSTYGNGFTTDSVVRWNGSARGTTYVSPSELQATITTADFAVAGSFPVTVFNPTPGGGTSAAQTFQVFPPGATPPSITTLAPSSTLAGGAAFTLTVNGANFNAGSVVRWNGADRATTFVSTAQLQAAILATDIASSGTAAVTVRRTSDNAVSSAQNFAILPASSGPSFTDDFNRADGANIGNGWLEKSASAFSLVTGEAAKVAAGGNDYRNNVVYRPANEDILDAESAVEFRLTSTPVGYPQVLVRVQSASVATQNALDAYLLYMADSATTATLARQRGTAYDTALANVALSTALNTTDRYRLRLRATGTTPVALAAYVERFTGSAWQIIGQASYNDSAANRISTAGSVGFGGYIETNYRFDNFSRTDLGTPNPAPTLSSITPSSAAAGSAGFNITVNGTGFGTGSIVRWNGSDRVTTFVSATQLTAQIQTQDVATQGTGTVTVFNPLPGGGTSSGLTFTITAPTSSPAPVATSLSPASANAGSGSFVLTVNGASFVPASVVRWNGSNRTTTFVSSGTLQAQIAAADVATAGTANISVFTPTPGGGTSGTLTFTIATSNPVPAITGLTPSSVAAGSTAFSMTVFGSGFVPSSTVRWNGSNRATTYVSPTQLEAAVAAADVVTAGTRTVTVFSPTPGGGTSGNFTFTVTTSVPTNPAPVLTQLTPNAFQPGQGSALVTVRGSNFTNQSVVQWNGQARTTTFVSSSELSAVLIASDVAGAGIGAVTVTTPAPGGGMSTPLTAFVQDAGLLYFFDGFNRPDSPTVGNNWTEKNPLAFSLQGNQVISVDTANGFQDDIMYRPVAESFLNVENSFEFIRQPTEPVLENANFPQLHARVQNMTEPLTLDSYIFFIEDVVTNRPTFAVTRSFGAGTRWECYIADFPLAQALEVGGRYRLRFRVSGTAPVSLTGFVDRFIAGAWETIGTGSAVHDVNTPRPDLYCDFSTLPPPVTTAGTTGVAKWVNRTDIYDNYYWRELSASEAVTPAVVTGLSPASAAAGSAGFQLTVTGNGFAPGATVLWNGAVRTTTYVSATQVRATITSADVSAVSTNTVAVRNSNGLTSNAVTFDVLPSSPAGTFVDGFDRADNASLGGGWIEKNPAAFSLAGGRAQKIATAGGDYRNNLVYRPTAEDLLNTEASVEIRLQSVFPVGYPMVAVRMQPGTIATAGRFDGYILYMSDSASTATLARQQGTDYDTLLSSFTLSQPLTPTDTYRLRLRASGSSPVQLNAYVERQNGAVWQVLGETSFSDSSASRIMTPGSVGFSGYVENNYSFDNFRRLNLTP